MSRFQGAEFRINGRVAHLQPLEGVTKLTVAVLNRAPQDDAPGGWRVVSTEVFGLTLEDPGLREYASQSIAIGDLVMVAGRLGSTHFNSGQATKPASGLKMCVTSIVSIPKRQADRLDAMPPASLDQPVQSNPPF